MASVGARFDPFLASNFLVEIDGLIVAGFSEVSGLQVQIDVFEFQEGGLNTHMHRLPGPARYPSNLVLKRGLILVDLLFSWQEDIRQGQITRRNGAIILLTAAHEPVQMWTFLRAFPVRWTGPTLRAGANEVAIETLELAHQGIERVSILF